MGFQKNPAKLWTKKENNLKKRKENGTAVMSCSLKKAAEMRSHKTEIPL